MDVRNDAQAYGGLGKDTIYGGESSEIYGGAGDDSLYPVNDAQAHGGAAVIS